MHNQTLSHEHAYQSNFEKIMFGGCCKQLNSHSEVAKEFVYIIPHMYIHVINTSKDIAKFQKFKLITNTYGQLHTEQYVYIMYS